MIYIPGYTPVFYDTIFYTTNLGGTWTQRNLKERSGYYSFPIVDITYANGYWVACGFSSSNAVSNTGHIYYSTSLDGTWTEKEILSKGCITGITYVNGYWVVCGKDSSTSYNSACIAYSTTLDGTWTIIHLWDRNCSSELNCIAYADGYYLVGGYQYDRQDTYAARISYSPTLDGFDEI